MMSLILRWLLSSSSSRWGIPSSAFTYRPITLSLSPRMRFLSLSCPSRRSERFHVDTRRLAFGGDLFIPFPYQFGIIYSQSINQIS